MATTKVEKKVLQVIQFLAYLNFCLSSQIVNLRIDNKRAISLTKNPKFYQKTKHIKVYQYQMRKSQAKKDGDFIYFY